MRHFFFFLFWKSASEGELSMLLGTPFSLNLDVKDVDEEHLKRLKNQREDTRIALTMIPWLAS
jgi:hypothetical protein